MNYLHRYHIHRAFWILLVLVALVPLALVIRPGESVADAPLTEDGYYVFTIARNIAQGQGIVIAEDTLTNGFQPLFTFLAVPSFWLAGDDTYLAIRYMLILHWLIQLVTAAVLGHIVSQSFAIQNDQKPFFFAITALLYLASLFVFLQHFNGLETGFLLLMYGITWRYYQMARLDSTRDLLILGALAGLVVLSRIDAVFFVIVLSLSFFFVASPSSNWTHRIQRFGLVAGAAFLVSLPWWAYNLLVFGNLMPSSGLAQQGWDLTASRLGASLFYVVQVLLPFVPFMYIHQINPMLSFLIQAGCVGGGAFFLWRDMPHLRRHISEQWQTREVTRRTIAFGGCLLVSGLFLVVWYTLSSSADYFYGRYFTPLVLVSLASLGALASWAYQKYPRTIMGGLALIAMPLILSAPLRYFDLVFTDSPHYHDQLALVQEHVPEDSYVGAFQSGTLGYFRERVVNLDGKVNPEALRYRSNMQVYLDRRGIVWLCGWEIPERMGWTDDNGTGDWEVVDQSGNVTLYHNIKSLPDR